MIQQIVTTEQQLIKLVKADIKKSAAEKNFHPTVTEIREQVQNFITEDKPESYPVFAFIDFTFLVRGFQVDMLSTVNYLSQDDLQKYLNEIQAVNNEL